ncbi:MAG: hypothetical protein WD960_11695 [Gemmatimonadota bacterium]
MGAVRSTLVFLATALIGVGPGGLASAVVPTNTRWVDMGGSVPPQIIPAESMASLDAIPLADVNRSAMWIQDFPVDRSSCDAALGHATRLLLALEIEGVPNEYTLVFESTSAEIVRKRSGGHPAFESREDIREPC